MDTKKQLEILEKKVNLIMDRLGLVLEEPKPKLEVIDNSSTRLELQKAKNEIRVLKIKFRKTPPRSPVRDEILKSIEQLLDKQSNLEAELDEHKWSR